MKKIIISLLIIFNIIIQTGIVFSEEFNVVIDTKSALAGETVDIDIKFENNTGLIGALFELHYDKKRLQLIEAKDGKLLESGTFSESYNEYPYVMVWNSASAKDFTQNGVLVSLKFKVLDNAASGKAFIEIKYEPDNVFDADLNNVAITIKNGEVDVQGKPASNRSSSGGMGGGSVKTAVKKKETTMFDNTKNQIVLTINQKTAKVFGETVENDVAPVIRNDRTMLPARFIAENLGAEVEWNESEPDIVKITKENIKILIYIGYDKAYVNDEIIILDGPAFIENDRTYTPLRFIAENLGAKVEWDEKSQSVTITKN